MQTNETSQKQADAKVYHLPIPFHQRPKKTKLDEQFTKFMNMFRKLDINIHFDNALAQMPHYAKFMKEITSKKRKLDENGIVSLYANCSAIIQKNLPQKM